MEVITRREAIERGLTRYFTGKPCKRGHVTERYVKRGRCLDCEKTQCGVYYAANKERIKARIRARYAANPERVKASSAAWNVAHPERVKARSAAFRAANPERKKASDTAYRTANAEKVRARISAWTAANPEKVRANHANRRACKILSGGTHTAADVKRILIRQGKRCVYCKTSLDVGYHVDHIIPLAKGGGNGPDNLQCLCQTCNLSKGDKLPAVFAQSIGMLL